MAELLHVLVTVSLVAGAETHADDQTVDGVDAIAGVYGLEMKPAAVAQRVSVGGEDNVLEYALDRFHEKIGIAELDNYEIEADHISGPAEAPETTHWL